MWCGALVAQMTTSAAARRCSSSSIGTGSPSKRSASCAAFCMVRFMTRTRPAPRASRLTAQSSATLPAPTSSTVASSSPSSASRATTAATEPTDAGLVPIAVSVRMRRPVSIALSKRRESTGPTAFSARLRRERLAHLPEHLRLARHERVHPAGHAVEVQQRALAAVHVEGVVRQRIVLAGDGQQLRDRDLVQVRRVGLDEVQLGAVAGRDRDGLGRVARA